MTGENVFQECNHLFADFMRFIAYEMVANYPVNTKDL